MEELRIREMRMSDIFMVEELEKKAFSMPWSLESFRNSLSNRDQHFFVADMSGRIVGYIGSWFILDEVQILNIAVAEDYRRCGIGRMLLEEVLELAAYEIGKTTFSLEVRASNIPAIRLYESYGFRESGRRKNYYSKPTEDAILMETVLFDPDADEEAFDEDLDDFDEDEFDEDEFDEDEFDEDEFDEDEFDEDEFDEDDFDEDDFDEDDLDEDDLDEDDSDAEDCDEEDSDEDD